MKSSKLAHILALSMLVTMPAAAADPDDAKVQQAVEAHNATVASEGDQVVCRKEPVTGSRIKKTVCRTQRTIEADQEAAKRYINKPRPVPYQD